MGYNTAGGGGAAGAAVYHGVSLTDTTGQALINGSFKTLAFATENWDTDAYHDNVTNNSRITIPAGRAGKYLIEAAVGDNCATASYKWIKVQKNTATDILEQFISVPPTLGGGGFVHGVADLAVGDWIELLVRVNQAGAVTTTISELYFQATFLGVLMAAYKGVGLADTAGQALSNGAYTTLNWGTEKWDTSGYHDTVTNKSRITIPAGLGGYYLVQLAVADNCSTNPNYKRAKVFKNGVTDLLVCNCQTPVTLGSGAFVKGVVKLVATDYIEFAVLVNQAGAQTGVTVSEHYAMATLLGA